MKEIIGERVTKEVLNKVDPVVDAIELERLLTEDDSDRFMHMRDWIKVGAQIGSHKEVEGTFTSWNKDLVKSNIRISCNHFHLQQRSAWPYIFSEYNTPLPTSAAVERLFSFLSDILRAKRSSLTADNFKKLISGKKFALHPYFIRLHYDHEYTVQTVWCRCRGSRPPTVHKPETTFERLPLRGIPSYTLRIHVTHTHVL